MDTSQAIYIGNLMVMYLPALSTYWATIWLYIGTSTIPTIWLITSLNIQEARFRCQSCYLRISFNTTLVLMPESWFTRNQFCCLKTHSEPHLGCVRTGLDSCFASWELVEKPLLFPENWFRYCFVLESGLATSFFSLVTLVRIPFCFLENRFR